MKLSEFINAHAGYKEMTFRCFKSSPIPHDPVLVARDNIDESVKDQRVAFFEVVNEKTINCFLNPLLKN